MSTLVTILQIESARNTDCTTMNDDTLPLYPGPDQASTLQLHKMSEIANEPQTPSEPPPPPVFAQTVTLVGPENALITCPFCKTMVRTSIKHTSSTNTHFLALRCCLLCCCCLPYCMESARNTDHYCPACSRYVGTYKK